MKKRVLALDVGDKRIGVAYSDPLGISANPLPAIEKDKKVFEKIRDIVDNYQIGTVVIGLPLTLKGEEGEQAKKTRKFAQKLKEYLPDIEIKFVDERFTTALAERQLRETTKKSKRKQKIDSVSAVYILKTYLDSTQIQ
ncbi:putative holliday junction resolvase [Persephonella hydrogeniphila]|uniref:Putative pre-16S rRNA nuclease n=1 Tax=Persephonella hydrogeniphila TaxID=198703 RepID=A0A285MY71_9AQUI|nr:Holliday junction resolvase RuvX [Persephonella hydrogeniphila]SNZ02135.1 putative holliday junction resolvase [Persephonella hydrogeniphila]